MPKDFGSQCWAIQCAIRVQDCLAECFDDLSPSWFARLDNFPGQGVGIDNHCTAALEHAGDGAFASGDAASESHEDHGGGAYHGGVRLTRKAG